MRLLGNLSSGHQAMGLVTSHSPSVVRRVRPEAIRHFRLDQKSLTTSVNAVVLPEADDEAAKFVREAVLAAPEIYFADLVILGEGDSEEIVIPRIAKALGIELDPSFVAFAPLGGRHVNHFWRLLNGLGIPMVTLLDFDMRRSKAGQLRLKYAHDQLRKIGVDDKPSWIKGDPKKSAYWKELGKGDIQLWRRWMEEHGVFFSYPLDLDMLMLRSYPDAYSVCDFAAPTNMATVIKSVFGDKGLGLDAFKDTVFPDFVPTNEELVAYDALFKKRGKPGSHLAAFAELSDEDIKSECPRQINKLIGAAISRLALVQLHWLFLADKGYDGDFLSEELLIHGIRPVIPPKANRKNPPACNYRAYKDRNRIERMFNRLKQFRRVATRYDKTGKSFSAFLALVATKIWLPYFFNRA